MTQGNSGFSLDLPPFVIASDINLVSGINSVGLRRAGFSKEERARIKEVFREIYHSTKTLQTLLEESKGSPVPRRWRRFSSFYAIRRKKASASGPDGEFSRIRSASECGLNLKFSLVFCPDAST